MSKSFKRGFTLIELLVVIAIIGILSSVVLASLNTARGKGADAAARSDVDNMRAQFEIYYDGNGQSYATACTNATISAALTNAATTEGLTYVPATPATNIGCIAAAGSWTAWVQLAKGLGGANYYCADNTGASYVKTVAATTPGSVASCGASAGGAW